jgi:hypothetical protein
LRTRGFCFVEENVYSEEIEYLTQAKAMNDASRLAMNQSWNK